MYKCDLKIDWTFHTWTDPAVGSMNQQIIKQSHFKRAVMIEQSRTDSNITDS